MKTMVATTSEIDNLDLAVKELAMQIKEKLILESKAT